MRVSGYPLDEQKKIAKILDRADALRQKRKQSLQLLEDSLRATFYEMFGNPTKEALPVLEWVKISDYPTLLVL